MSLQTQQLLPAECQEGSKEKSAANLITKAQMADQTEETAADNYMGTEEFDLEVGQEMATLLEYIQIEPDSSAQRARFKYL